MRYGVPLQLSTGDHAEIARASAGSMVSGVAALSPGRSRDGVGGGRAARGTFIRLSYVRHASRSRLPSRQHNETCMVLLHPNGPGAMGPVSSGHRRQAGATSGRYRHEADSSTTHALGVREGGRRAERQRRGKYTPSDSSMVVPEGWKGAEVLYNSV